MARKTVYNSNITDEKWNSVLKKNKDLLNEFIEYLESTDKSEGTVTSYTSDIRICWVWNLEFNENKFFIDFTKRDVMKYQNYMLNTLNLSSNRIRRLRAAISSLSNFIESMMDDVYKDFRPIVNKIPAPAKVEVREKTILSDEQAQTLLDYLVEKKEYQHACIFALAWASGSRKSELTRFKVSFFKDENIVYGSLYKTPEKIKTKGRSRKLGKQLNKYALVGKFKPYLDLWLDERSKLDLPEELEDVLFVAKTKESFKIVTISMLDTCANNFSKFLDVDFYFHCMRHNFTTGLSKSGIPPAVIQEICGWDSLQMVDLYDDQTVDDKLGKYFDENGIKEIKKSELTDL